MAFAKAYKQKIKKEKQEEERIKKIKNNYQDEIGEWAHSDFSKKEVF